MDYFTTRELILYVIEKWHRDYFVRFAAVRATKISVHCKNVNMVEPNGYIRDARGKFSRKRKLEWKLNFSTANKRRRIEIYEKKESIVNGRRIVKVKLLAHEMWCIMVIIMKITVHLKFARELAVERRCQTYWLASRYLRFLYNFSRFNM